MNNTKKSLALMMLYSGISNLDKFDYKDSDIKGKTFKEGIKSIKIKKRKKRLK